MVTCWRTNDDLKNGGVWPPLKFFVDFIKRIESYYILCLHIACTYVCGCSIAYTSYSNSLLFSKPKIFGERLTLTILHMVHIRVRNPIFKVRYVQYKLFMSIDGKNTSISKIVFIENLLLMKYSCPNGSVVKALAF